MKISVIICCYNSANRIGNTLLALANQVEIAQACDWEVLVVDNNCSDETVAVARRIWSRRDVPLRFVHESTPGQAFARRRGIKESTGEFIVFCDDDNWLSQKYLRSAYEIMVSHPDVALVGGRGIASFEGDGPTWFAENQKYFACGEQGANSGPVGHLYGAGFILRRSAFENIESLGFVSLLSGRTGKQLACGEDIELCFALRLAGWGLWYENALEFFHWMPKERMTSDYLYRLALGVGISRITLGEYGREISRESISEKLKYETPLWGLAIVAVGRGILAAISLKLTRDFRKVIKLRNDLGCGIGAWRLLTSNSSGFVRRSVREFSERSKNSRIRKLGHEQYS